MGWMDVDFRVEAGVCPNCNNKACVIPSGTDENVCCRLCCETWTGQEYGKAMQVFLRTSEKREQENQTQLWQCQNDARIRQIQNMADLVPSLIIKFTSFITELGCDSRPVINAIIDRIVAECIKQELTKKYATKKGNEDEKE